MPAINPPSSNAIETCAREICRKFKWWNSRYTNIHFSEEDLRLICETALALYEGENSEQRPADTNAYIDQLEGENATLRWMHSQDTKP